MATLQELLLTPERAPHVIADTKTLVDDQIASKGITAAPLKAAYKAVTAFAPGYLHGSDHRHASWHGAPA